MNIGKNEIKELEKYGIKRDRLKYFLNITYPSLQIMENINDKIVFQDSIVKFKKFALYINIPFCSGKCAYCHYFTISQPSQKQIESYISALKKEILFYKEKYGEIKLDSLYIGGGTPTLLTEYQLHDLLTFIECNTEIPENTEISIEAHPDSITDKKLDELLKHNVNRINIGIDDFDEKLMLMMNRRHNYKMAIDAFNLCREKGLKNINLDLIRGVIYQKLKNWEYNLDKIEELAPDSFTTYYLRLKKGTMLYYRYLQDPQLFPTDDELLKMQLRTFEKAREMGYKQNMADWFINRPEIYHKYQYQIWNEGETTGLIGIGASAYSYLNFFQYYNINDVNEYITRLNNNKSPIWRGRKLSMKERMNKLMVLGLRGGVDKNYFKKLYGRTIDEVYHEKIDVLENLGLIDNFEYVLKLTEKGSLFADEIGRKFYSITVNKEMEKIDPSLVSTTYRGFNK